MGIKKFYEKPNISLLYFAENLDVLTASKEEMDKDNDGGYLEAWN